MPSAGDGKSGLLPVFATAKGLQLGDKDGLPPLFFALPATPSKQEKPNKAIVPLYEYTGPDGQHWFSTNASEKGAGNALASQAVARVWNNPTSALPLDNLTPLQDR